MESKSTGNASELELVRKDKETGDYIVKHRQSGNICAIVDTFAEMFPMWVGRILITSDNEKWALTAAREITGFAASIIMSPAEAGIESVLSLEKTVDNRVGVLVQIYHRTRRGLKTQMISRIGQCVMTCPTTAAFDALPKANRRLKVGRSLRLFGDGFQKKDMVGKRKIWRIPVLEGEFKVEDSFGAKKAVAGGNFLILAEDSKSGLKASENAVATINKKGKNVVLPFPGGVCRSGSKAGSLKYKLPASTNHPFCPRLKKLVPNSQLPDNVHSVYEIVINGLNLKVVEEAMALGIRAAVKIPGVVKISAANFGGKLGPYHAYLRDILDLERS
jgi:formylmethanofuran--tetrahydromethanopterin N-formyltransferase